jgi:hypothetical protein
VSRTAKEARAKRDKDHDKLKADHRKKLMDKFNRQKIHPKVLSKAERMKLAANRNKKDRNSTSLIEAIYVNTPAKKEAKLKAKGLGDVHASNRVVANAYGNINGNAHEMNPLAQTQRNGGKVKATKHYTGS